MRQYRSRRPELERANQPEAIWWVGPIPLAVARLSRTSRRILRSEVGFSSLLEAIHVSHVSSPDFSMFDLLGRPNVIGSDQGLGCGVFSQRPESGPAYRRRSF